MTTGIRQLLIFTIFMQCSTGRVSGHECNPKADQCEVWLSVQEKLTMTWHKTRVYAFNGSLYSFKETPGNVNNTQIPLDEVITMDGFTRSVTAVNNTIPGPPIIAYENQKLIIHVINHLLSEAITIHWHGLHQKGTPFMDGVSFITQCPIDSGQRFTYKFEAYPSGTFWYHSHIGGQRVDGLFGALIIKPREQQPSNQIEDMIMHVGDWFHDTGATLHTKLMHGNFESQPGFIHPKTLDGVDFAPVIFQSAHIEGRGRFKDTVTGTWIEAPYKVYNVTSGNRYRFRLINPGTIFPFRVSIDQHSLMVVATDGFEVKPREFESIVINPGERYDFIIEANQPAGDYWIRADGMEIDFDDHYARGVLRYDSLSKDDPTSQRQTCTTLTPCEVLNCQFLYYPDTLNTTCVFLDQLASNGGEQVPPIGSSPIESFQNWVQIAGRMGVNGKLFEFPSVSSLTQPDEKRMDLNCDVADCKENSVCNCHHEIDLPFNKTVQMVWTNHGTGSVGHHPIHMHGHSFHVLKLGFGSYEKETGRKQSDNLDIDCPSGKQCNNPSWTNKNWTGDNIPGLNLNNPIQKDTLMIPVGGYAVIRFRSDNPDKWLLHCHIQFHIMQGMALTMNEAQTHHIPPPVGFPICKDFQYNSKVDVEYVRRDGIPLADDKSERDLLFILCIVLAAAFVIQSSFFILYCCCSQRKQAKESKVEFNSTIENVNL